MPSRADVRRRVEWALRVALVAVLAFTLSRSLPRAAGGANVVGMKTSDFDRDIRSIISSDASEISLGVDAAISRTQRDLLRAVRGAGTKVTWHGDVPSMAIEVSRERDPFADGRVALVSGSDAPLAVSDSAGPIDTLRATSGTIEAGTLVGSVRAVRGGFFARGAVPKPTDRRAVLVLGRVGWEVKFVAAALTEAGWTVRSSSPAAPTVVVQDDALQPIDTARYDAIIALDSTASTYAAQISRFVLQGGGLVALGSALDVRSVQELAPADVGDRQPGRILLTDDTITTRDLPTRALINVRNDAVALGREKNGIVLAAHRVGLGRVLAVGYDETWRLRMLGGESGPAIHREWWSHAAAAVAPAREAPVIAGSGDAAPRAAIVDELGPPGAAVETTRRIVSDALPFALLIVIVGTLLVETASRRFRGAP